MNSLLKSISKSTLLHPILFSIFPIIFLYSENMHEVPFRYFVIPLLSSIFVTLLLLIVVRYILKNKTKSAIIVSLFVFLFLTFGHFKNLLSDYEEIFEVTDNHVLAFFLILFIGSSLYFVKTKRKLDNLTLITNSVVVVLVVMVLINIGSYSFERSLPVNTVGYPQSLEVSATLGTPDVYFILLDGYANQLTLQKFFGYENQEFTDSLSEQGFFVPNKYTNSNYQNTEWSVPSILNMNYINQHIPPEVSKNYRVELNFKSIDNNIVMQHFKDMGYKNINFRSGWFGTDEVDIADETLCENVDISWHVINKIKATTILPKIEKLNEYIDNEYRQQKSQQILCAFSELPSISEKSNEPVFVFMHVMAPHPPWVFPKGEDAWKGEHVKETAYVNTMKFINKKVIESTEKLISESNNEAIIVILSDHGTRIVKDRGYTPEQSQIIKFGNLMAFYLPNEIEPSAFETTPVNVFRLIFNSYFNGDYKILEDKVFSLPHKEIEDWETRVNKVFG